MHNIKKTKLLKHFKIGKMFQHVSDYKETSIGEPQSYLAKITHLFQSGYVELVQDVVGVMAAYCDL